MSARFARRRLALAACALLSALPAAALAAGGDASPAAVSLAKLLVGLVAVVAAVLIFSRVLSRMTFMPSGHDRFRVLASLPVGARERVVLMQAGERQIVVGVAPGRVSALHVLDEPLEIGAVQSGTQTGPAWLQRVLTARTR